MKISIIMCVMNSMPYIMTSIESFKKQKYKNKELIIVQSNSNDNTDYYLKTLCEKNIRKFKLNGSIYQALNFGIAKAKGQLIGVLHSDDIFFSPFTLNIVAKEYKKKKPDIIFGNILYCEKNNLLNIKRSWSKISIKNKFDIPPHTGTFITKKLYKKYKYSTKYLISSDTDFLINIFSGKINYQYVNYYISIMRMGGISSNYTSLFKKISEDIKIYREHKLTVFDYFKKIFFKSKQFIVLEKLEVKKYHKFLNNVSKINFLNLNKKENIYGKIISALNLAFITFNYKFKLRTHNYIFWPDGIFTTYITNIKKIPGREFFRRFLIKINKKNIKFKKIYILGNLPSISKLWLEDNLNHNFNHINLPYGNIKKINKELKKIYFLRNSLIILTLPTPKQELIANLIFEKSKKSTILCIGGSINILSGYEKKAPSILYNLNLEWFWRLKFDSKRRFFRLFESLILYLKLRFAGQNNIF